VGAEEAATERRSGGSRSWGPGLEDPGAGGHQGHRWRASEVTGGGRARASVGGAPGSPARRGVASRLEGSEVGRVARPEGRQGRRLGEGWRGQRGRQGSPVGGGAGAGGSAWVAAAWAGAAGAMGENERIRAGAMGDAGAGAMGDAGAGGIRLQSTTA
jgi:hypothetical protein